ncbi:MAG: CAP domain-containing protein [Proteobacteria bacterium]|nr:CAP domain-containing protein [Pseudomonadota bacterium]
MTVAAGIWRYLLLSGVLLSGAAQADVVAALQSLRAGGCGGTTAAVPPVQRSAVLDRAAQAWSEGADPDAAMQSVGYEPKTLATFHLPAGTQTADRLLHHVDCRRLADPALREFGLFQRDPQAWLVLATPRAGPPAGQNSMLVSHPSRAPHGGSEPLQVSRQVDLINAARARGARCGSHQLGPAPPLHLSMQLSDVALGHAVDMARHNYFEHEDLQGHTPAERVRAAGYPEKLVGENIAYGPKSAEEVVRGWLDSPGHCENIMDARFSEVGIAYTAGSGSKRGLYWVQVFAAPKA